MGWGFEGMTRFVKDSVEMTFDIVRSFLQSLVPPFANFLLGPPTARASWAAGVARATGFRAGKAIVLRKRVFFRHSAVRTVSYVHIIRSV